MTDATQSEAEDTVDQLIHRLRVYFEVGLDKITDDTGVEWSLYCDALRAAEALSASAAPGVGEWNAAIEAAAVVDATALSNLVDLDGGEFLLVKRALLNGHLAMLCRRPATPAPGMACVPVAVVDLEKYVKIGARAAFEAVAIEGEHRAITATRAAYRALAAALASQAKGRE